MTSTAAALPLQRPSLRRWGNALGSAASFGMLGFGFYLQYVKDLQPCPLCMIQRVFFVLTGVVFLAAAIHHPVRRWGAHLYGALTAVFALAGAAVAVRHIWIQHTPEALRPACSPGWEFLLDTFGPLESIKRMLHGSGECGRVDWTFLTLSIPEWALIGFLAFAVYGVVLSFKD